ncbi:MAG: DUF2238 domain-containing protein [Alphaproteobacteria bacterium]|nr:DUF2238 domain-containing protein [Alphaproteobacteria bacterium]
MSAPSRSAPLLPAALCAALVPVLIWSWVGPYDRATWWMEAAPVLLAVPILAATWRRFPLTPVLYVLIWLHAVILLVGAHYTYALVPVGEWARDAFDLSRNHYDRLGHFAQGFVPAIAARELLLRLTPLKRGGWLFAILTLSVLGISAAYELIEWIAAEIAADGAADFLGSQGDIWDAQKDMALALIGAVAAQLLLPRLHDRHLTRLSRR